MPIERNIREILEQVNHLLEADMSSQRHVGQTWVLGKLPLLKRGLEKLQR